MYYLDLPLVSAGAFLTIEVVEILLVVLAASLSLSPGDLLAELFETVVVRTFLMRPKVFVAFGTPSS
jgi:hypothetical protein